MPDQTNAAGGQPAAKISDAGRASISAVHYITPASGFLLCDTFRWGRLAC
jgi:hypothetical protein